MMTELDNPKHLDFSENKFSDESLPAIVKYIFANDECPLLHFNIENNMFTQYGKRTLLKAYSLSVKKNIMQLKVGPMSLNEANLKIPFIMND